MRFQHQSYAFILLFIYSFSFQTPCFADQDAPIFKFDIYDSDFSDDNSEKSLSDQINEFHSKVEFEKVDPSVDKNETPIIEQAQEPNFNEQELSTNDTSPSLKSTRDSPSKQEYKPPVRKDVLGHDKTQADSDWLWPVIISIVVILLVFSSSGKKKEKVKDTKDYENVPSSAKAICVFQGLCELSGVSLFLTGIFFYSPYPPDYHWAVILGGIIMLIDDFIEMNIGVLNPLAPIMLAMLGVFIAVYIDMQWYIGLFWSTAVFKILGIPTSFIKIFTPSVVVERAQNIISQYMRGPFG